MKLATTKLVLLEVPNPKLPHLMSLTPLLSTRKITQQCLPGKFEIGYLVKAYALMIMCPALVRLTGKLTQIRFLGRFRVWVVFGFLELIAPNKTEFFESIWHIDRFTDEELQLIQYELR